MASPPVSEEPATAVVVPIRSFEGALSRLEHVLGRSGCRDLMRAMAGRVADAAGDLPVHVATDDAEVAAWAADLGAEVVTAGRPGLNIAVTAAVDRLAAAGSGSSGGGPCRPGAGPDAAAGGGAGAGDRA